MLLPAEVAEPARAVAAALVGRGETVAVAESSAGGLISAALLSVPGASAYYLGGTVIYTAAARTLLAGVVELPEGVRGASDPFARYLATAVAAKLGAGWGVSETGATGPTGNPYGDPAGHAWVAVCGPGTPDTAPSGASVTSRRVLTGSDAREDNMAAFAAAALNLLLGRLSG